MTQRAVRSETLKLEVSQLEIRTQTGPSDTPADTHKHTHANAHSHAHTYTLPNSNSQTDLNLSTLFEATFSDLHGMCACVSFYTFWL